MDLLGKFLKGHRTAQIRIGSDTVEVFDYGLERVVKYNGTVFSRISTEGLYTHDYWDFFLPLGFVWKDPRMLIIGLGGGTVAYQLGRLLGNAVSLEAAELNREMIEVMKVFLKEEINMKIHIGDGADFVKGEKGQYNAIILDAYINDLMPKQFFAREFVESTHAALTQDGIFAFNYIKSSNGYGNFDSYVDLLKQSFKVYRVRTGFFTSNTIVVCSKKYGKDELTERINASFKRDGENDFVIDGYERMTEL